MRGPKVMAPKAKGESKRGLVVTLVFFILSTIGAGVAAYYGFQDQEKKDAAVKKAQEKEKIANEERDFLRVYLGRLLPYLDKPADPNSSIGREFTAKNADLESGAYPE